MHKKLLELLISFEWDEANFEKNYHKHGVHYTEAEEVFVNDDVILLPDPCHSLVEKRFYVFGKTNNVRNLAIVFAIRQNKVRVIMARDMSKKERGWYEKENQKHS